MRTDYKFVTVVYRVEDHAAWQPQWDEIHRLFKLDDAGVRVTAVSLDDEISRKDAMARAAEVVDDHHDLREVIGDLDGAQSVEDAVAAFDAEYPER